jgi:hypothetical protein
VLPCIDDVNGAAEVGLVWCASVIWAGEVQLRYVDFLPFSLCVTFSIILRAIHSDALFVPGPRRLAY